MRPSRSESESNIVPSSCDLVLRSVRSTRLEGRGPHAASSFETRPSGAPQDEVRNTYGARGRIALSGGGLRPHGPVGSSWFQLLPRAPRTFASAILKP